MRDQPTQKQCPSAHHKFVLQMDPKHTGSAVHEGTRCEVTLGSLTLSRAALLSPGLIHRSIGPWSELRICTFSLFLAQGCPQYTQ